VAEPQASEQILETPPLLPEAECSALGWKAQIRAFNGHVMTIEKGLLYLCNYFAPELVEVSQWCEEAARIVHLQISDHKRSPSGSSQLGLDLLGCGWTFYGFLHFESGSNPDMKISGITLWSCINQRHSVLPS